MRLNNPGVTRLTWLSVHWRRDGRDQQFERVAVEQLRLDLRVERVEDPENGRGAFGYFGGAINPLRLEPSPPETAAHSAIAAPL